MGESPEKDWHVMPDTAQGGWNVRPEGERGATAHFQTKDQAIAFARAQTRGTTQADVIVHDRGINDKPPDWVLEREAAGVTLRVNEEDEALPPELREAMDETPALKGIPQGQIQPKQGRRKNRPAGRGKTR